MFSNLDNTVTIPLNRPLAYFFLVNLLTVQQTHQSCFHSNKNSLYKKSEENLSCDFSWQWHNIKIFQSLSHGTCNTSTLLPLSFTKDCIFVNFARGEHFTPDNGEMGECQIVVDRLHLNSCCQANPHSQLIFRPPNRNFWPSREKTVDAYKGMHCKNCSAKFQPIFYVNLFRIQILAKLKGSRVFLVRLAEEIQ